MSISFNGLGSGLAVSDIVDALVNAEQAPAEARLNTTEGNLTTDISAAGALKSALEKVQTSMDALGDVDSYQQRSVSGSDDFISISSDKDAQPGRPSLRFGQPCGRGADAPGRCVHSHRRPHRCQAQSQQARASIPRKPRGRPRIRASRRRGRRVDRGPL